MAGAMTYAVRLDTDNSKTYPAVRGTATLNGYTTGGQITVSPSRPPTIGAYNTDNLAVEAIIRQVQTVSFARLFDTNATTVTTRAVAKLVAVGDACVLTLTDSLILSGNFSATAPNCMLASNKPGQNSINIGGSSTVNVNSLTAVGECAGCYSNNVVPGVPVYAPNVPTRNPYAALDLQTWPSYTGGSECDNSKIGSGANLNGNNGNSGNPTGAYPPTYSNAGFPNTSGKAYCSQLHMQNGDNITFSPGIYVFYNAPIKIDGGSLTCIGCTNTNGVHIVQIDPSGQHDDFDINAAATVVLSAGTTVPTVPGLTPTTAPALTGVLFYRTATSQNFNSSEITINGGATTNLAGGIYFPNADAHYNGNNSSPCTVIVGGGITMNGTAGLNSNLATTGCSAIGTPIPQIQSVKLVE